MSGESQASGARKATIPRIDSCRFGLAVIDGRRYARDVIVFPDHVMADWWREEGHSLSAADLWEVLQGPPEVLVVGLGHMSRMLIPTETLDQLNRLRIELIAEPTAQACDTYNRLREARRVVAALHLTC